MKTVIQTFGIVVRKQLRGDCLSLYSPHTRQWIQSGIIFFSESLFRRLRSSLHFAASLFPFFHCCLNSLNEVTKPLKGEGTYDGQIFWKLY
jgi:hypothetical protein